MGFETVTTVKCSKKELVALGSDFYNEWADFRMKNNKDEVEYLCRKYDVLESLQELSNIYPCDLHDYNQQSRHINLSFSLSC